MVPRGGAALEVSGNQACFQAVSRDGRHWGASVGVLLLPIGVVVALARANTAGESYFLCAHVLRFRQRHRAGVLRRSDM
jgi:hypothetical protein